MEDTNELVQNNEIRNPSSTQLSLPEVLTDVSITDEEQKSDRIRQAVACEVNVAQVSDSTEETKSQCNSTVTDDPGTQILQTDCSVSKIVVDDGTSATQGEGCGEIEVVGTSRIEQNPLVDNDELVKTCSIEEALNAENDEVISFSEAKSNELCEKGEVDYVLPQYTFSCEPQLITGVWEEFKKNPEECYTKGCKWSPDGTCILTNSEDNLLRIFDLPRELHCQESWPEGRILPEMKPTLFIKEGGRVYDYCWYPFMSSWNPLSCCLVSTSQYSPVHLWDAYTGQLRASYRSYNHVDEIEHAFSLAFNLTGEKLYCGYKKRLSVFHTASPGSECENRSLKGLGRPVSIVSCISVNPVNENIYAFSSYSRIIGLCAEPDGIVMCLLCNEGGGLSHVLFSPDGTRLYAGSRKDSQLFCWDMRNLGKVLFTADRTNNTNQRIYFDLTPDGRFLVSGSTDGSVRVWDTQEAPDMSSEVPFLNVKTMFKAHNDCVNGLSLHKQYPIMATSSGQRHPYCPDCESDEEAPPQRKKRHVHREDTVKLWWMGGVSSPSNTPQS